MICYENEQYYYRFDNDWIDEIRIYPSKQSLIESQINYWKNLLSEELEQDISSYCAPKFEGDIKGFKTEVKVEETLCAPHPCKYIHEEIVYIADGIPYWKCNKCGAICK